MINKLKIIITMKNKLIRIKINNYMKKQKIIYKIKIKYKLCKIKKIYKENIKNAFKI